MLKEYAVDPSCVARNWDTFRLLLGYFGYDQGRLISRFPQDWEKQVIEAARAEGLSDRELKQVVESLKNSRRQRLAGFGRSYDHELSWLENAAEEQARHPFDEMIGDSEPCLAPGDCHDDNPRFDAPRSYTVSRAADAMVSLLLPLMRPASDIDIIDRYLDLQDHRYVHTLSLMLDELARHSERARTLRFHYGDFEQRPSQEFMAMFLAGRDREWIPEGFTLRLHFWQTRSGGDVLHDRHIITELGGVNLGHAISHSPNATTSIGLMDSENAEEIRARFVPGSSYYLLNQPVIVVTRHGVTLEDA